MQDKDRIQQAYRDYLKMRVSAPEVKRDKRGFLETYFYPPKPFIFRPAFYIPGLSLMAVLILFLILPHPTPYHSGIPVSETQEETAMLSNQPVAVKRITSAVGPTMVYQKTIQETPITIIWVFAGGNVK